MDEKCAEEKKLQHKTSEKEVELQELGTKLNETKEQFSQVIFIVYTVKWITNESDVYWLLL